MKNCLVWCSVFRGVPVCPYMLVVHPPVLPTAGQIRTALRTPPRLRLRPTVSMNLGSSLLVRVLMT